MELVAFQGLLVLKCLRSWLWEFGRREKTNQTLYLVFPFIFYYLFSKQAMKGLIFLGFVERINVLLRGAKVSWENNSWFWTHKNFTARDKSFTYAQSNLAQAFVLINKGGQSLMLCCLLWSCGSAGSGIMGSTLSVWWFLSFLLRGCLCPQLVGDVKFKMLLLWPHHRAGFVYHHTLEIWYWFILQHFHIYFQI